MREFNACQSIQDDVIAEKFCTRCGACLGMCPYWLPYKGKIVLRDICNLPDGRCYHFCPRKVVDLDNLSQTIFGTPYTWDALGTVREVMIAQAKDAEIRGKGQYGGTATALILFAINEGIIDAAVLTKSQNNLLPEAAVISTREGVLDCTGSNYVATPTLEAFNRGVRDANLGNIGVVGTPCQVLALANMRCSTFDDQNNIDKLKLVIGLFCTWALSYESFAPFIAEKVAVPDIVKMDIPPPPANTFDIYTTSQRISLSLDEVREYILPACNYCIDMTAEFSDISVGAAEGINDWNTIIVRSERGNDLVRAAEAKGIIETGKLPSHMLDHLKEAALVKKKRALRNIVIKTGSKNDFAYLKIQGDRVSQLFEQ